MTAVTETLLAFDVGAKTHEFVHETAGTLEQGKLESDLSAIRAFLARLLKDGRRLRVIMEATASTSSTSPSWPTSSARRSW